MASETEGVKLLGFWSSPYSLRAEIALRWKGVEYEFVEEDISNKSERLLRCNPVHGKIPVLVHRDRPLAESLIIVEYIDETWKHRPILPEEPYQRAMARFWANFIDDKVSAAVRKACLSKTEAEREEGVAEAKETLRILESELRDKRFFGGEDIGFVDIAATVVGYWLVPFQEAAGVELFSGESFPKLYQWSEELVNHPAVKPSLPDRDKLRELIGGRIQALRA